MTEFHGPLASDQGFHTPLSSPKRCRRGPRGPREHSASGLGSKLSCIAQLETSAVGVTTESFLLPAPGGIPGRQCLRCVLQRPPERADAGRLHSISNFSPATALTAGSPGLMESSSRKDHIQPFNPFRCCGHTGHTAQLLSGLIFWKILSSPNATAGARGQREFC